MCGVGSFLFIIRSFFSGFVPVTPSPFGSFVVPDGKGLRDVECDIFWAINITLREGIFGVTRNVFWVPPFRMECNRLTEPKISLEDILIFFFSMILPLRLGTSLDVYCMVCVSDCMPIYFTCCIAIYK